MKSEKITFIEVLTITVIALLTSSIDSLTEIAFTAIGL